MRLSPWRFILAVLAVATGGRAAAVNFGIEDLKRTVEKNQVRSIEQLLPLLPAELRRNYTLMRESLSIQGASPLYPRAILFGSDAQLILTFNGDPRHKGHAEIEAMDFDPKSFEISMHKISFSGDGSPAKFSEKNPRQCTLCHGQPARYIWSDYNKWFGAYGMVDDQIGLRNRRVGAFQPGKIVDVPHSEEKDFIKFQKLAKTHPRYKYLEGPKGEKFWPYYNDEKKRTMSRMPNFRLAALMSANYAKSVYADIKKNKVFNDVIFKHLTQSLCQDRTMAYPSYQTYSLELDSARRNVPGLSVSQPPFTIGRPSYRWLAYPRFTTYTFNLNPDIASILASRIDTGTIGFTELITIAALEELREQEPWKTLIHNDQLASQAYPRSKEIMNDPVYSQVIYPEDNARLVAAAGMKWPGFIVYNSFYSEASGQRPLCQALREEAAKTPDGQRPENPPYTSPEKNPAQILVKASCVGCHSDSETPVGPAIDFTPPLSPKLLAEVKRRIHAPAKIPGGGPNPEFMPRAHEPLKPEERETLVNYLSGK